MLADLHARLLYHCRSSSRNTDIFIVLTLIHHQIWVVFRRFVNPMAGACQRLCIEFRIVK